MKRGVLYVLWIGDHSELTIIVHLFVYVQGNLLPKFRSVRYQKQNCFWTYWPERKSEWKWGRERLVISAHVGWGGSLVLADVVFAPEVIQCFIENQAFSPGCMIWLLNHHLPPSPGNKLDLTTHTKSDKERQLADATGDWGEGRMGWGLGRSQIKHSEKVWSFINHSILSWSFHPGGVLYCTVLALSSTGSNCPLPSSLKWH
jgi:hypothetical protein